MESCFLGKTHTVKVAIVIINALKNFFSESCSARAIIRLKSLNNLSLVSMEPKSFMWNFVNCASRNSKLIWYNTNWFPWAAMKCYTDSINSLFINAWPIWSFAIQNAAGFHKVFKPSLNAVSVWRVLSKLISKFMLYCSWWFQFIVPKNTLCFLLNGQHFS